MNAPILTRQQQFSLTIPVGWRLLDIGELTQVGDYHWNNALCLWLSQYDGITISISSRPTIRYRGLNQVTIE